MISSQSIITILRLVSTIVFAFVGMLSGVRKREISFQRIEH
jgi:hypothetical protein